MINKILVPLDSSTLAEQILPYVKIIAEGTQFWSAALTLIATLGFSAFQH